MQSLLFNKFPLSMFPFIMILLFIIPVEAQNNVTALRGNWSIQSSDNVKESGEVVSTVQYAAEGWYPATVPSTVMSSLVDDSVYKDIFLGENLAKVDTNRFKKAWWYRTEFKIKKIPGMNNFFLLFDGINYRADIYLNGKKIAGADSVFGVYRRFDFNVNRFVKYDGNNVLAVKVYPPKWSEPTIGFVDWNPRSPDDNMGIWRDVSIKTCGDLALNFPFVKSKVDLKTLKKALLTISAEVKNNSEKDLTASLEGAIGDIKFSKEVTLRPGENKIVEFTPKDFPQLIIKNPHLWWTNDLGDPYLYKLKLQLKSGKMLSDLDETHFGIREVSGYINKEGYRGYKLNGRKILIRGGGWADDIFLKYDHKKLAAQIAYVKQMGLNAIRFEGFWGSNQDIYNLCDENGLLIMTGFSCQWEWSDYIGQTADKYGAIKTSEDIKLVTAYWRDEIKWLRNHPSILVWLYGSDKFPRPVLERKFLDILKQDDPTRPSLSSAAGVTSGITGPSAVKMNGPYDYEPPVYWLTDTSYGGAFGFNTETGPGPQIPPVESIKKMIPANDLWPIDSVWDYHCGRHQFRNLNVYNKALDSHYGRSGSLQEYEKKAQLQNYDAMRAMYEAFTINKPVATGIIQWMLNSAWPEFYWQLYDYYLMPNGAFYGAMKANEPVHIAYNYSDGRIIAVNNTFKQYNNLTAYVRVLKFDLSEAYSFKKQIDLMPYRSQTVTAIPQIDNLSETYFLVLNLKNIEGKIVSRNFYCLSRKRDELDFAGTKWFFTPIKQYADFTELNKLKKVKLNVASKLKKEGSNTIDEIEISNPGKSLAFQIRLAVKKGEEGQEVLPSFWDDNYFSLLPGEKRIIKCRFSTADLNGRKPFLKVSGWNIAE